MLRQIGQANGIGLTCRGEVQHAVITGELAFDAQASFYPEQDRIQRKKDESDLLKEISPVVSTTKMFHLMQDDLLKFLLRKFLEQYRGKKDSRPEESDNTGAIDFGGDAKPDESTSLREKVLAGSVRFNGSCGCCNAPQFDDILKKPDRSHQGECSP
jgi:hypothetical protein